MLNLGCSIIVIMEGDKYLEPDGFTSTVFFIEPAVPSSLTLWIYLPNSVVKGYFRKSGIKFSLNMEN
ncbi:hypothetical protein AAC387_Pa07g1931 [Persea americana]